MKHYEEARDEEHTSYMARHRNLGNDVAAAFQSKVGNTNELNAAKTGGHEDTVYVSLAVSWAELARELAQSAVQMT